MKRDPFLHWLLTLVTFSLYSFVWTLLLLRDVNGLKESGRLNLRRHVKYFSLVYGGLIGAGLLMQLLWDMDTKQGFRRVETIGNGLIVAAFGLTVYWVWLLLFTAKTLRELRQGAEPTAGKVILFTALWGTSLPYLQAQLNKELKARSNNPG